MVKSKTKRKEDAGESGNTKDIPAGKIHKNNK